MDVLIARSASPSSQMPDTVSAIGTTPKPVLPVVGLNVLRNGLATANC